jgi:phenylacetate-coenzyme A ligase PaaK-like adenylate-forming protein
MLLHNCFAYHFTRPARCCRSGARALGCPVFPAGPGNTESQARAAAHLRPACYAGTPDFLKTILEAAMRSASTSPRCARPCHRRRLPARRCAPSTPIAA